MNLLQELTGLAEAKKKPCCKKCEKKANKEIADKLSMSANVKESLAEIFGDQLNEGKSVGVFEKTPNGAILTLYDDFENPFLHKIAKSLGVHDGGNLVKLDTKCFAAYVHGGYLTFVEDPHDYVEED